MNREELMARLKEIRVSNNDLWMQILEIALSSDPIRTKKVMSQVAENDKKVVETFWALTDTSS